MNKHPSVSGIMLRELERAHKIEMIEYLQDILNDHEVKEKFMDDSGRSQFFVHLKDILKQSHTAHESDEDEQQVKASPHENPGVFFNLAHVEAQLKDAFIHQSSLNKYDQEKETNNNAANKSGGVHFSLMEMMKQYVNEVNEPNRDINADGDNGDATGRVRRVENEHMFDELQLSNVSVGSMDTRGGVFFSLAKRNDQNTNDELESSP